MVTKREVFKSIDGRGAARRKTGAPSWRGDPDDKLVGLAARLREEHRHDEAIHCYKEALESSSEKNGILEHASLRKAIVECLCAKGEYTQALKIVDEMKYYLAGEVDSISRELENIRLLSASINLRIGSYEEAEVECRDVLQCLDVSSGPTKMKEILMTLGSVSLHQGDLTSARRYYEDCLNHLGDEKQSLELARVLNHLAQLRFVESEWLDSLKLLRRSLRISRSLGDERLTASIIGNLGTVHLLLGNWDEAQLHLERSLELWRQLGDLLSIVRKYISLGNLCMMRREWKQSEEYYGLSREISREKGYMRELCLSLEFSGELAFDRGKFNQARGYYDEALALALDIAPRGDLIGELHRRIAELKVVTGDLDAAVKSCEKSLSISLGLRDRYEEAIVYRVFGQVFDAKGEVERARSYFSQSIDGLLSINERYERGKTLFAEAEFLTRRFHSEGDFMEAERHFREAAAIFKYLDVPYYSQRVQAGLDILKKKRSG